MRGMTDLAAAVDALAAEGAFSGVVRIDHGDEVVLSKAYGFADRRWKIPNAPETRFATASGVKGMTALAVMSLVEDGTLDLATTARSVLGADLPLIDDAVTVEQLLAHRSGIGDYFDEDLAGRDLGLPAPGSRAHAQRDGGLPRGARRLPDEVPARRAVLVLQRRVRRPRPRRRARERHAVPGARGRARLRAGRDDRHRVPPLRRAACGRCGRLLRHGGAAHERAPPARAGNRRRRRLHDRSRHAEVVGRRLRRPHRLGERVCRR